MSEYQYYEFQAIDRPLTAAQMAELRALSTRATITPNRFVNVYNYGDFKGGPERVLAEYFDAFVYVTNWGTYQLMFRLPRETIDQERVSLYEYEIDPCVQAWSGGDFEIIGIISADEEGDGWIDDEESERWLPALLPLRADLMAGDYRSLYLGWLVAVQFDYLEEDEVEPPVPAGLGNLSAPLKTLIEFLQVDPDLLAVAAERSGKRRDQKPTPEALLAWVKQLSEADKNDLLARLIATDDPPALLRTDLLRRYRQEHPVPVEPSDTRERRTATELIELANARAEKRRRDETDRKTQARNQYLDGLAEREDETWDDVELLIASKKQASYDQAVATLIDLRDLARRQQNDAFFSDQLRGLRTRHAPKSSFIRRLEQSGLGGQTPVPARRGAYVRPNQTPGDSQD